VQFLLTNRTKSYAYFAKVLNVVPRKARRRAVILMKCLLTVNVLTDFIYSMWLH